jgi:hypothetical protein
LLILLLVIGLFSGCGKNEPTLPKSYENISFTDLMEIMELKKTYSDGNSTIYESEAMDSKKYKNTNFYNYNEPMNNYCNAIGGKVNVFSVLDKLDTNYLREQIDYSKVSTFYCKKDNTVLFAFFTEEIENSWKKYSQYKYYFVNSKILSNEVNNFLIKKDKEDFIKAENKKIKVNNKALFSQGIDNEATNNEIRKLISKITPKPYNFVWSCETVDSYKLAHTNGEGKNIVKKCTVNTDIGITFKATCTYTILSKETGYTLCEQGL